MDINNVKYDLCKIWIRNQRERMGRDWDTIQNANKDTFEELQSFLKQKVEEEGWPEFVIEDGTGNGDEAGEPSKEINEWKELVLFMKNAEESTARINYLQGQATIVGNQQDQNSDIHLPEGKQTAWQCYLKRLKNNEFHQESINAICDSTLKVLRQLSVDTTKIGARKGLVIGNVQSGKTANMAALMALAADWGYNMFIVLSGTIEALRIQTQKRLYNDLHNRECNLIWRPLEHLSRKMNDGGRAQDLDFSSGSQQRYFTVALKNGTRLRNLIQWLQADPNSQRQMKILVIDDEADQAGINTGDVQKERERRTINNLIMSLVNGRTYNHQTCNVPYQAMNYIGYTATPYANVLNEAGQDTLYPKDFITTLAVSREYFGPQQIFGYNAGNSCEFDGLNIIREICSNDTDDIKSIHDGNSYSIPNSLRDAICWFLCGVSCMRKWEYKKPISLLVHTSQRVDHHSNIADAISSWINRTPENTIIKQCKTLWENETKEFSKQLFREEYPNYAREDEGINDYLAFNEILPELRTLISGERVSFIKLGDDDERRYHRHIHLCIDNCAPKNANDDDYVRLAYPDKEQLDALDFAPAFIVVGGATLSRGLTIEGLISTFFMRSVSQADTLMQMGRWFGYRRGYELIPRIWMTQKTNKQFKFLAELDQELRDEIHTMEVKGQSPMEYGPRIINSPKVSFIKITANNRQQLARPVSWEFGGSMKQTYMFDNDATILNKNLNSTKFFLEQLGDPIQQKPCNTHSSHTVVWKDVQFDGHMENFLKTFIFNQRLGVFNEINPLLQWIKDSTQQGNLENWSVILAGTDNENRDTWKVSDAVKVRKVIRSQKKKGKIDGVLNIGTLRTATDSLADIDLENASPDVINRMKQKPQSKDVNDIRIMAGVENIPQLIIYIIDKDSKARANSAEREDLNAQEDVVGICINLPGEDRTNNVGTVAIDVSKYFDQAFDGDGDIDEDDN